MKNFVEKVKDFLYDATDYVLILVIIVGVVAVIGWRLDILFAKDMDNPDGDHNNKAPITDVVSNEKDNNKDIDKDNTEDVSNENDSISTDDSEDDQKIDNGDTESNKNDGNDNNTDSKPNKEEIITVKIPSGSFPPAIANILLEKGLIENKMDFLIKSQELKLDTKLKSGEFKIKVGTSLEELIRILAK